MAGFDCVLEEEEEAEEEGGERGGEETEAEEVLIFVSSDLLMDGEVDSVNGAGDDCELAVTSRLDAMRGRHHPLTPDLGSIESSRVQK